LSPDDSKGSTLDPDTVAHEHENSSFQTTDTVLPMLPASAGATAAKVLVCFFVLCYLLNSSLGGREKEKKRPKLHQSEALFYYYCFRAYRRVVVSHELWCGRPRTSMGSS
jgi:hypothetical protein